MASFRRRRRGSSLLEAFLAIAIIAVVLGAAVSALNDFTERQRAETAAQKIGEIVSASKDYLKANTQILLTATEASAVRIPVARTSTGAEPFTPSFAGLTSLQGGGFLPGTYIDNNPYGQHHALIVRQNGDNRLEALVVAVGGRAVGDSQLGQIAGSVGAEGGFMASAPLAGLEGMVTGTAGGWGTPSAEWTVSGVGPTAGRAMASMALDEGAIVADYLHRRDIGIAEANRMRVDLSMGDGDDIHSINDVRSITTTRGGPKSITMGNDSFLSLQNNLSKMRMAANGQIVLENDGARLAMENDGVVSLGNSSSKIQMGVDGEVTMDRNLTVSNNVTAKGDVQGNKFIDDDDVSFALDPNQTSRIFNLTATGRVEADDLSGANFDLDALAYGRTTGSLKGQTVGEAVSRLWGCRLQYSFTRSGMSGNWVDGPMLDGTENTGAVSRWASAELDTECSGSGCGVQMRVKCGQAGQATEPPPVTETGGTCPSWAPGTWPNGCIPTSCPSWAPADVNGNCVYTPPNGSACPPWMNGSYPNCSNREPGISFFSVQSGPVGGGRFAIASVQCPHPSRAVAGGGVCQGGFPINSGSIPKDNGWEYGCGDGNGQSVVATAIAVCANVGQ